MFAIDPEKQFKMVTIQKLVNNFLTLYIVNNCKIYIFLLNLMKYVSLREFITKLYT